MGVPQIDPSFRSEMNPVGKKISTLRSEGVPRKQSVATALNMQSNGRLTPSGGYIRVGRKRSPRASGR